MRITPLDIRKQEFRKAMRGLDAEEVYAFLSTVGDEYEAVLNENKALSERLIELDDKVQEYRAMEKTLRDTLLTAERVTMDAKDNARREANIIIKEAQIEAEKALRNIKSEAMKLRQEVSQLRGQRESYLGRMKVIAESLLGFIESVEDDFHEEDEAYQSQLPEPEAEPATPASSLADPPLAENRSLFGQKGEDTPVDDAGTASADPPSAPGAKPGRPAAVTGNAPEPVRPIGTPGPPSESQGGGAVDSHSSPHVRPHPVVEEKGPEAKPAAETGSSTKPEGDDLALAAPPASGDTGTDPYDGPSETGATLKDINAIIERMAEGQKEVLRDSQPAMTSGEPSLDAKPEAPRFDPLASSPNGPAVSSPQYQTPRRTPSVPGGRRGDARGGAPGGAPQYKPERAPESGDRRTPVRKEWESVPEVATALELPAKEVDSEANGTKGGQSTRVRTGKDVTSELSLDQIRRDLETLDKKGEENK